MTFDLKAELRETIVDLEAKVRELEEALHRISLASQNSMSSKGECGRIARAALKPQEKQ